MAIYRSTFDDCMPDSLVNALQNYGYKYGSQKPAGHESHNYSLMPNISKVIFNDPATIVLWDDGTKTVVKCSEDDAFDAEKGLAFAIIKRMISPNSSKYYRIMNEMCTNYEQSVNKEPNFGKIGEDVWMECAMKTGIETTRNGEKLIFDQLVYDPLGDYVRKETRGDRK